MSSRIRMWRITAITTIITLLLLVVLGMLINYRLNGYKAQISNGLSAFLGVRVRINGRIRAGWDTGPAIIIKHIELASRKRVFGTVDRLVVGVEFMPLFYGAYQIRSVALIRPKLQLAYDKHGAPNIDKKNRLAGTASSVVGTRETLEYTVRNGALRYDDQHRQQFWRFDGINFSAEVSLRQGKRPWHQRMWLRANMHVNNIRGRYLNARNARIGITGDNGRYRFVLKRARMAGGIAKGNLQANTAIADLQFRLQYKVRNFNIGKSQLDLARKKIIVGKINLHGDLYIKGTSLRALKENINGVLQLEGANLRLETLDLDNFLDKYRKSQRFNLVDIGAYFFVGPLGTVASKSYDFAGIYKASKGGKGEIRQMISRWKIKNGIANAADVALTTPRHRVALRGQINLRENRLEKLILAIVDAHGCPLLSQRIVGTLDDPKLKKTGKFKSLVGPIIDILKKPGQVLTGKRCKPFYTGSLSHPEITSPSR